MPRKIPAALRRLFGPEDSRSPRHLWPRWLWLRALGLIFLSAFYSWFFQIRGLIGPDGILPAGPFLKDAAEQFGAHRYWMVPSLLWLDSSDRALLAFCGMGLVASLLLVLNVWPRAAIAVCVVVFLSFVSAAQDFATYQSDGMLLAAGFLSLFFAPPGWRPGLGEKTPPSRASLFLLQWLWFRIYFESGVVKWGSHDPEWRHLTALDHYYENGPLPDWIGWYAQQLPHAFQAFVALATLSIELGVVWMLFLPRRFRRICFFIVTPFQIGIILTANLTFLNYFVLALGFLLLDDQILGRAASMLRSGAARVRRTPSPPTPLPQGGEGGSKPQILNGHRKSVGVTTALATGDDLPLGEKEESQTRGEARERQAPVPPLLVSGEGTRNSNPNSVPPRPLGGDGLGVRGITTFIRKALALAIPAFFLTWIFYNTAAQMLLMFIPALPLAAAPLEALEPFRISERYGLFAVMTRARYEIEFQGSRDGTNWIAYPFRYKPQDPREAPGLYAPYQPRFDWNLWFASLGGWREYPFVVDTEVRLLQNSPEVLALFAGNPFGANPPREIRAVEWQYWFTDLATKRKEGLWWRRKFLGLYAPELQRDANGKVSVVAAPEE